MATAEGGAYGGHTDLTELDNLGMYVVLTFERERLRHEGVSDAAIFTAWGRSLHALVYDVSTLAAIDTAERPRPRFADALEFLQATGSPQAPGFDVLTLEPERPAETSIG